MKVRQPLASVTVPTLGETFNFEDILIDELNVKEVKQGNELALDLTLTDALKREGLMREVVRHVQSARKAAGLNVDDHIRVGFVTEDTETLKAIAEFVDTIKAETLTDQIIDQPYDEYQSDVKIEGSALQISLKKV